MDLDRTGRAISKLSGAAAAAVVGLVTFLLVIGPAPIRPTNILWLRQQIPDSATSYLGWAFYRATPWSWPPTANPRYGLELAGSTLMSDSNPLFALLFKLFSPILPIPFQYFGIWLVICFGLQAALAYLIARQLSLGRVQALIATILFLFLPTFIGRTQYHLTLCGQWELLAALLIYISPRIPRRTICWISLIVIGVLTNPYLLLMVGTIWLADVLRALRLRETEPVRICLGAGAVLAPGIAVALASGVYAFSPSDPTTLSQTLSSVMQDPPVTYRFNLASPFDSAGWSHFLPKRAHPEAGEYEGLSFAGAGWWLLFIAAAVAAIVKRKSIHIGREHYPLLFLVLALLFFAVSPFVSIGDTTFLIPWPTALYWLGSAFRATARFIWPVFYLSLMSVVFILYRTVERRALTVLLGFAAILQVADTSAGWARLSPLFAKQGSEWPSPMRSPLWTQWAKKYRAIRWARPTRHYAPDSRDLSYFALRHGLGANTVYLARFNAKGFAALSAQAAQSKRTGRFGQDSLWILDNPTYQRLRNRPACGADFVGEVDGYLVLAPGQSSKPGPC